MNAVGAGSRWAAFWAELVEAIRKHVSEPFPRTVNFKFKAIFDKCVFFGALFCFVLTGYFSAVIFLNAAANHVSMKGFFNSVPKDYHLQYLDVSLLHIQFIAFALFLYPLWKFLEYAADFFFFPLLCFTLVLLAINNGLHPQPLPSVFFLVMTPFLSILLAKILNTLYIDKDRQAHLLFLLSMAALGWALWLQNGGNWQNMAVLDSPIVLPLVNWKIPFTDSIGFLFSLLGFVHDPVAGSLSVASQASISALALFFGAGVLFLFAEIRLHKSAVGVQPRFCGSGLWRLSVLAACR